MAKKDPESGKLGKRHNDPRMAKDGWFPPRTDPKPVRRAGGGDDQALGKRGRKKGK